VTPEGAPVRRDGGTVGRTAPVAQTDLHGTRGDDWRYGLFVEDADDVGGLDHAAAPASSPPSASALCTATISSS
jgi:hypothetical protein